MEELPEGFVLEAGDLPAGFQLEGGRTGLAGSAIYGLQGAMRAATAPLDLPGQLMNFVTGRQDRTLGQTVRQAIGSAQERAGAITGLSAPGTRYQYENIEEVPPEFRPSARAGEASGAALPFIGALGLAARGAPIAQTVERALAAPATTGVGAAGSQAVRQMVADAASNPYFVAAQIPATAGAAAGGYAAEAVFPGSELAQLAGQFSGGLLGAAGAAAAGAGGRAGMGQVRGAIPGTEEAARVTAGRELAPILQQAGEAPEQIIQRLRTPDIVPGALPAELAQSRGVTGVQALLARQDPELANLLAASRERVATGIRGGVEEAFQPGALQALTQAATTQRRAFDQRLDSLVSTAEQRAARLAEQAATEAAPIAPLSPSQARGLNIQARNILEDALTNARKEESALWKKVPTKIEVMPTNTIAAYDDLRANMIPEEALPGVVDRVMKRYKLAAPEPEAGVSPLEMEARAFTAARQSEAQKPITTGELLQLRSSLLEEARDLRAQNNYKDARRVGLIADAVLDDLTSAGAEAAVARDFSVALNDRFSRSFAGDILGTKPSGAERVRPELTLEVATTGQPEKVAAQLAELRAAVAEQAPAMQQAQEGFLRSMTERIFNATTGAIKPAEADRFVRNNAAILEQFPRVRDAIQNAANAQRLVEEADLAVKGVLKQTGDAARQAEKAAAFSRVLAAGERPEQAIASAISSPNPVRELTKLSTLALRGGKDAAGGLRAATLKYATDSSMKNGELSYGRLSQVLTDPLSDRGESLLQVLQRNKIMTTEQKSQVEAFVKRGIDRELADFTGVEVKEFGKVAGMAGRYIPRIIGAKLSSFISGPGAGESLQIAQMSANVAERIASKLPADKVNQVMAQALKSDTPDELISILQYAASYTPSGGQRAIDPMTRELISALRVMLISPGYQPERPPGGAAAFRPEMLGRR